MKQTATLALLITILIGCTDKPDYIENPEEYVSTLRRNTPPKTH